MGTSTTETDSTPLVGGRYIRTFLGNDKKWYFVLVADNGEPIAVGGQGYENPQDMHDVINKYLGEWPVKIG